MLRLMLIISEKIKMIYRMLPSSCKVENFSDENYFETNEMLRERFGYTDEWYGLPNNFHKQFLDEPIFDHNIKCRRENGVIIMDPGNHGEFICKQGSIRRAINQR